MTYTFTNCTSPVVLFSEQLTDWAPISKVLLTVKQNKTVVLEKEIFQQDTVNGNYTVSLDDVTISEGVWEFTFMIEFTNDLVSFETACSFFTCDNTFDNSIIEKVGKDKDVELMLYYYVLTNTTCDCYCDYKVDIYNWIKNRLKSC